MRNHEEIKNAADDDEEGKNSFCPSSRKMENHSMRWVVVFWRGVEGESTRDS